VSQSAAAALAAYAANATPEFGIQPSPFDYPTTWNQITVSGQVWTGKIDVKRASRKYWWDNKTPPGQEGQNQTYRGRKFPPFTLTFYFWDTAGFNAWMLFSQLFLFDGTKAAPQPFDIYHPALAAVWISQVQCEELRAPEKLSDDGMYAAEVELVEFKPPPALNVTATPAGAANTNASAPGPTPDPALDALMAEEAALYNTAVGEGLESPLPAPVGSGLP
jgi:hypothetical protein